MRGVSPSASATVEMLSDAGEVPDQHRQRVRPVVIFGPEDRADALAMLVGDLTRVRKHLDGR